MAPTSNHSGTSSTFSATVNLAKYCIGAGVLALPYATQRGGLLFSPLMIGVIAAWNWLASTLLMECKYVTKAVSFPASLSSMFSRVAFAGAGSVGLAVTDFAIITTLLGVCITFQITFATLLRDVPGNTLSVPMLSLISGLVVYPMSCLRDLSAMANLSLLGMVCLVAGVSAILAHGFNAFGAAAFSGSWDESSPAVYLWPSSFEAAGSFLGIVIFCFDICSLAFPIEESMQHKAEFSRAVIWAMITVWALYTLFGDLGALLYAHDTSRGIGENVLSNLPVHSSLSLLVRWAMACVGLLTYPITLAPAAQMVEHQLTSFLCSTGSLRGYSAISERSSHGGEGAGVAEGVEVVDPDAPSDALRCGNRLAMVAATTFVASALPCFGMVISLLGGFTIAIVDFILPPLLHLRIVCFRVHAVLPQRSPEHNIEKGAPGAADVGMVASVELSSRDTRSTGSRVEAAGGKWGTHSGQDREVELDECSQVAAKWGGRDRLVWVDCALLAVGSVVCAGTTTLALVSIYKQVVRGQSC